MMVWIKLGTEQAPTITDIIQPGDTLFAPSLQRMKSVIKVHNK